MPGKVQQVSIGSFAISRADQVIMHSNKTWLTMNGIAKRLASAGTSILECATISYRIPAYMGSQSRGGLGWTFQFAPLSISHSGVLCRHEISSSTGDFQLSACMALQI